MGIEKTASSSFLLQLNAIGEILDSGGPGEELVFLVVVLASKENVR
jgi:hypothetical protein